MIQSWDEYLSSFVCEFRNRFEELSMKEKSAVPINMTFLPPCQIEVVEFQEKFWLVWMVTYDKNRPDMEFVHSIMKDPIEFIFKKPEHYTLWKTILAMHAIMLPIEDKVKESFLDWFSIDKESSVYLFSDDPRVGDTKFTTVSELVENARYFAREKLKFRFDYKREETISILRKELGRITEKKLPSKLLDPAKIAMQYGKKIDMTQELSSAQITHFKRYEKRIDEIKQEIGGMRKLIGISKEFQDWRTLISEVERLKKNHVSKEVLDSEMRRLDQGLKGLDERIEDLKAIKLWSLRTVVDIILAVVAIVATLFAAGMIRF